MHLPLPPPHRYLDAVLHILGPRHAAALAACQLVTMALAAIGLMIAGAGAMQTAGGYICEFAGAADCRNPQV